VTAAAESGAKPKNGDATAKAKNGDAAAKAKNGDAVAKAPAAKPPTAPSPAPAAKNKEAKDAPPAQVRPAQTSRELVERMRRQRMRATILRMLVFVVLPTGLATLYYGSIATDQYESYAKFTVHSVDSPATGGIDGLLGSFAGASGRDTLVVRDHIQSRDMLAKLNESHDYIEHWQAADIDFIARLESDASLEDAFEHYLDQVEVTYDSNSSVLTLRVRAASPEKAQELSQAIIAESESMVNKLSERERRDRTRDAEEHLAQTEARLGNARQAVLVQQQEHSELNPQQTAGAAMTVRTALEAELARARSDLMQLRAYMTPEAPDVRAAEERVKAIGAQVGAEKARLVNPSGKGGIAGTMAEFEAAMVEKEFAEAAYTSGLAALETARVDAARQHRYLAVVSATSMPDESTHPKRALGVLTAFMLSFLLMGIGSLLIASVREHARI